MKKSLLLNFIVSLFVISCGGGKGDDKKQSGGTRVIDSLDSSGTSDSLIDSDGDGIPDREDPQPFIAEVPIIGGEFFNKMRVDLWSTGSSTARVATWEIDFGGIDVDGKGGSKGKRPIPRSMVDYYLKKGARATSWKAEQVPLDIDTDYLIDSFASPMMNREEMLKISSSLFKRDLTYTLSANIDFQSDFSISSSRYKNFKDLNLSVFYLTPSGDVRELENIYVPGQYAFNSVNPISNRIQLRDQDAIDALIVSGSRLFVKVSDFTIIDTGEKYRDIIKRVREKSIPLLVSAGSAKPETFYVGLGKNDLSLKSIIEKVYGSDQIRISSSSIDSIRGLSNRLTRRDDWSNEFSQWVVGTNQYLSPFDYNYSTRDTVTLGYYSNYEPDSYPVFMQRHDVDEKSFFEDERKISYSHKFFLEDVSQKIELVVRDDKFLVPHQKSWGFIENHNGGECIRRTITKKGYGVEYRNMDIINELKNSYVEISNLDGVIVRERVGNSQIVELKRDEKTKEIVISINDLWKFGNRLGRLFVNFDFSIPKNTIRLGEEVESSHCVQWPRTPTPHRGNEMKVSVESSSLKGSQYHIFNSQFSGLITVLGY